MCYMQRTYFSLLLINLLDGSTDVSLKLTTVACF